jgi:hypothetical protein
MKTLILVLALFLPPTGYTDDCLARLFETLRQIDVRVRSGQFDEPQRYAATRRALIAYLMCKGVWTDTPTSPRPD